MAKHFRPWNPKQKWLLPMVDRIKANLGQERQAGKPDRGDAREAETRRLA
jgi:hypothetical protein